MTAADRLAVRRLLTECFPRSTSPQLCPSTRFLLFEWNGRPAGFAIFRAFNRRVLFDRYGVSRRHRRRGLGREIIRRVVKFAAGRPVRCYAAAWNCYSINVLFSCGFRAYTYPEADDAFVYLVHSNANNHRRSRRPRNGAGDAGDVRRVRHFVGGKSGRVGRPRRR